MTNEELNEAIREICHIAGNDVCALGVHPADADEGPSPWPAGCVGAESWPKAQQLRRKLIAEINNGANH